MSAEPMWDFVETLDYYQLELLDYAITYHMSRHIEKGRTEEQARERWADLLHYMVETRDEVREGMLAHG
jgi:peptidase E